MILSLLFNHRGLIFKRKSLIQVIILAVGMLSLVKTPYITNVTSGNLLNKDLIYTFKILPMKFKDEFEAIKSPANTILIICKEKDKLYLDLLYGSIKNLKIFFKEIVVTTSKPNLSSKYFAVIYLSFGNDSYTKIYPLRNTQPNTDLASISDYYFSNKYHFSFRDLIYQPKLNFPFTLEIQVEYSRQNILKFFTFLRTLINCEAFTSGKYFYIPFLKTHYDMLQLFPFCLLTFLFYFIDWLESFKNGDINIVLINICIFYFFPVTCLFSLFFKREKAFLMMCYYFIHFRFGFLCSVFLYSCAIRKMFFKSKGFRNL